MLSARQNEAVSGSLRQRDSESGSPKHAPGSNSTVPYKTEQNSTSQHSTRAVKQEAQRGVSGVGCFYLPRARARASRDCSIYREIHVAMKPLLVHFANATVEALNAEKARTGCSVSEFIRRAVAEALKKAEEVNSHGKQ